MRYFEITLILLSLPLMVWLLIPSNRKTALMFTGTAASVLGLHLAFEGVRWQMIPTYVVICIVVLYYVCQFFWKRAGNFNKILKNSAGILGVMCLIFSSGFSVIFPVLQFPELKGPFAVGTEVFSWTDEERGEIFTTEVGDKRELPVQIYYPAALGKKSERSNDVLAMQALGAKLAEETGLPEFVFSHLKAAKSRAYVQAVVSQSRESYPVLIFSHGQGSFRALYTHLFENLASHGYIIASVDHTYSSYLAIFPDGGAVRKNDGFPPAKNSFKAQEEMGQQMVKIWAADLSFVLDKLEELNEGTGRFAHRLDLAKVGVLGHSFGGAAAMEVCLQDERFKTGVNLDGTPYGEVVVKGLHKPFMVLSNSEYKSCKDWAPSDKELAELGMTRDEYRFELKTATSKEKMLNDMVKAGGYHLLIKGTNQNNFTDLPFYSPLMKTFKIVGKIDSWRSAEIVDRYTLAFFEKHLQGRVEKLLDSPSANYPEVEWMK